VNTCSAYLGCTVLLCLVFPRPPRSSLFPYTTLFRSVQKQARPRRCLSCAVQGQAAHWRCLSCLVQKQARPRRCLGCAVQGQATRSEEHTSELQSRFDLVCRLLLEKKKNAGTRHSAGR